MARKERVVADPVEVAIAGRQEIDLHKGSIQVQPDGIDWGDYEINAFMAKQAMGEVPVDEEIPNRVIVIPLILGAEGDFDAARITVQAWAAKVNHQGGGHLKREIIGGSYGEAGSKLFCDCVKATLKLSGDSAAASDGIDANAVLTVEALPDFYGDRIELPAFEGFGEARKTFQIEGNLPGRAEIFVEEQSGHDQLALLWHLRCQDFDFAAPWTANVSTFERFGAAVEATVAGSFAPKVVQHPSLGTDWMPVAAATLLHKGLYEAFVRVFTTSDEPPEVRLLYDVGDLINPSETMAKKIPGSAGWYLMSLGQVNLQELPIGDHRWRPMLQARGAAGGENVAFDRMWFLSAAESSGTPTAPRKVTQGLAAPLVFDSFNQASGGAATGESPQVGPAYTVCTGSDTDDFQIDPGNHVLTRNSASDSGSIAPSLYGRAIGAGTAKRANHVIAGDVSLPHQVGAIGAGHIIRWVDSQNMVAVLVSPTATAGWTCVIGKWRALAGGWTILGPEAIVSPSWRDLRGRLETVVYEGRVVVSFEGKEICVAEDSDLDPGGPLAEGRAYFYDHSIFSSPLLRTYDNLEVAPVNFEAVNFANQQAWLSYRGLFRMGPNGEAYGPIARQVSDLPRVPVSGPEGRPVELAVKTSRGDLESIRDSANGDPLAVRLAYHPCWSSVPGL